MADHHQNGKTLYLIDGSGFIFRAFYALPPLTRPDGTPVGAVMGFCNMLLRVLEEAGDDYVAVVFDAARLNFRNEIYPEYKANRSETPEDLIPQFPLIREATKAFGLMGMEQEGYEADDLIAAYAKEAESRGVAVKIVSSDKDLMQLMRKGVSLFDPIKFQDITLEQVEKKFGVTPDKVVDVQALAGDATDNVPGVPGIGVKTAAQLIGEYGDLETLLARAGEIKQPKRREMLLEHADMARISKKLVVLDENAPMPVDLDDLDDHVLDMDRLLAFLNEQGFRTLTSRVMAKWGMSGEKAPQKTVVQSSDAPASPPDVLTRIIEKDYTLIIDEDTLQTWMDNALEKGVLAFDTETTSLTPAKADLVGIGICIEPGKAAYIPIGHKAGGQEDLFGGGNSQSADEALQQIPMKRALAIMKPVLTDASVVKIAHNTKYDLQIFYPYDIAVTPVHDTMLMSYVLDGSKNGHGLDELSKLNFDQDNIKYKDLLGSGKNQKLFNTLKPEEALDYAAEDADMTRRLYDVLARRLFDENMLRVYEDIERPLIPIIARMEYEGIHVSREKLAELSKDFDGQIHALEKRIWEQCDQEFNIGSPKQIGDVLFGAMGLEGGKKTKTGAWSTDANTLEKLAAQGHKVVADILEWRGLSKLKSTYTDALQEQINLKTGRLHTSFSMAVTNTGRLSSSDPNLQNIPIRTEEGRKIRTAFVAAKGYKLVSIDYSQVELRLIAELGKVDKLRKAFRDGVDIHSLTASEVFGIPIDDLTPERRRAAKAINFGIIYGISGYGLARQLGCEPGEAGNYIKDYLARFPEIPQFMEYWKDYAKRHGYVVTHFGRKIHVPDIASSNHNMRQFAERQAINAPLQGTAADIMKMAMRDVARALGNTTLDAKMLLQVHDELIFEVAENDANALIKLVSDTMRGVVDFDVPLLAEAGIGDNWDAAH